jgi:CubicO group peptidase (beta-lactamase class C family)
MTVLRLGLAVIGLWAGNAVFADDVDELVRSYMQKRQIPGLSLAVIKDGKMIKAQGYGLANLETQAPASPETVYKIGSISKPLLAAAILLLADEGKLGLDDKLPPYLPGTPEGWKEITIRHLLSHTSGLIENPPGFSREAGPGGHRFPLPGAAPFSTGGKMELFQRRLFCPRRNHPAGDREAMEFIHDRAGLRAGGPGADADDHGDWHRAEPRQRLSL